jgi:serine/threonine protein kinase
VTWLSNDAVDRLRDVATRPEMPSDRYAILRPIGRGGMGTVYAARDRLLNRDVALKVSNAPVPESDLDHRLRQEARVLAALEHPGVVPIHDAGVLDDGRLFYVMTLVRGDTLATHAATLASEVARLTVFERIAETVAFAHAAGIVHRDLKPSNVMVGRFGEVLLLDWGVAKLVGSAPPASSVPAAAPASHAATPADSGRTGHGVRIGTSGFMAPEQARGDAAEAGPPADVYALGALLCWMLTGDTPASAAAAVERLSAVQPPAPPRLRSVIGRCLAERPADRYDSAAALVADLARYRQGQSVSAHRDTLLERAGRAFTRYQTFVLLLLAYLIMRAVFAWSQR